MTVEDIEWIRAEYPPGTKVILFEMKGEPQMLYGMKGEVTGVDDAGQIHVLWENGSTLALTDQDMFEKINTLRVIVCRPMENAEVIEIEDDLKAMQDLVGGMIEEYMPFYDEKDDRVENVAIVCDDEGKMKRSQMNRAILDDDGKIQDIIAGTFFICYAPIDSDRFLSLPEDLEQKFKERFKFPEMFLKGDKGIQAMKYMPVPASETRETAR